MERIMKKIECFKIQILQSNDSKIFKINNKKIIYRINCDRYKFLKEPNVIFADPFLFVYKDCLYLFYERKSLYHPGVISMVYT